MPRRRVSTAIACFETPSYHQVRIGIFPRFRRSTACREYASLHLRRLLVSSVFLDVFLDAFAGEGSTVREQVRLSQALDFYLSALKYQETYAQLVEPGSPPKPSESSKAMAGVICSKYKDTWLGLGLDSHARELIQRQLPEASLHLFDPVLKLALNALEPVYDEWLDSDTGVNFCLEVVGLPCSSKVSLPARQRCFLCYCASPPSSRL